MTLMISLERCCSLFNKNGDFISVLTTVMYVDFGVVFSMGRV